VAAGLLARGNIPDAPTIEQANASAVYRIALGSRDVKVFQIFF
jgi:hypothetical protein